MEAFPIIAGLACGILVGSTTGRWRAWQVTLVAVGLGLAATILTGEWRISWLFLLVDIPLVAVSALVGSLTARAAQTRRARGHPKP